MHSTSDRPSEGTAGGIQVWTAILLFAVVCMAAFLYFQVQERRFYEKQPSVWPKPEASPALQALVQVSTPTGSQETTAPLDISVSDFEPSGESDNEFEAADSGLDSAEVANEDASTVEPESPVSQIAEEASDDAVPLDEIPADGSE